MRWIAIVVSATCFSVLLFWSTLSLSASNPSLEPHLLEPEAYSETYGFVFSINETTHLVVQLSVSNLGLGDRNGMCRVLYLHDGKSWSADALYDRKMWSFAPPASLKVGTCSVRLEDKSLVLSAELNQATFKAVLYASLNTVKPPNHFIQTVDGFFDQQILVRWGKADITVQLSNKSPSSGTGYGCMYRFWVTALPLELAYRWIKVFGLDEKGADLLVVRFPPGQSTSQGWRWLANSKKPFPTEGLVYKGKSIKAETIEGPYLIVLHDQLDRYAPVENIGFWSFLVKSWIGNPVTYTYLASIKTPGSNTPKSAIVEIMEDETN